VDVALCIGIGSCQAWAPEHFELSDHRVAVVVNAAAADEETIVQAAMACPVEAITVESEAGERLWPLY
jgi:ferredoxin